MIPGCLDDSSAPYAILKRVFLAFKKGARYRRRREPIIRSERVDRNVRLSNQIFNGDALTGVCARKKGVSCKTATVTQVGKTRPAASSLHCARKLREGKNGNIKLASHAFE